MSFTILLPFLYHLNGGNGGFSCLNGKRGLITGREAVIASRRVSFAGEQFLCRRGAVPYQREEEAEREKNSILSDKVTTFPVCFQFVSNR